MWHVVRPQLLRAAASSLCQALVNLRRLSQHEGSGGGALAVMHAAPAQGSDRVSTSSSQQMQDTERWLGLLRRMSTSPMRSTASSMI